MATTYNPVFTRYDYDITDVISVEEVRRLLGLWTDDTLDAEIERARNSAQRLLSDALRGPLLDGLWTVQFPGVDRAEPACYEAGARLPLPQYVGETDDFTFEAHLNVDGELDYTIPSTSYRIEQLFGKYAIRIVTDLDLPAALAASASSLELSDDTTDTGIVIVPTVMHQGPVWKQKLLMSDIPDPTIVTAVGELTVDGVENNGSVSEQALIDAVKSLKALTRDTGVA